MINARGYANVVQLPASTDTSLQTQEVKGLIYLLTPNDEAALDVHEGVPEAYTKEIHVIDYWSADALDSSRTANSETVKMLVYVDRKRTVDAVPKEEYIYRMNQGIHDALANGVPEGYVTKVMRGFIPFQDTIGEAEKDKAEKQAKNFKDDAEAT